MDSNDVIIIGGGINGVCTAYHLAKNKVKTLLVDKSHIAGGPTGVSSAIVRQHYSNPITIRMALESLDAWKNFREITGEQAIFTETGFLLGARPEDIESLKANISMQQSIGINTRFVSVEEMRDLEPHLDSNGMAGAAYEPESGYCDPIEAANGFASAARHLGATIKTGLLVTGIQVNQGKVIGVLTEAGRISAGNVIIAAGPWSNFLLQGLNRKTPMITSRVNVGIYRRPDEFTHHGIWADFITQVYLRPETGGLMLVGSISPQDETKDQVSDPDHFNERVDIKAASSLIERAAMRFPAMERSHVTSSYASLYDITPDWHHIMDAVPGIDGLYLCAGGSGHGFKLGPAVGRMMAEMVVHGKDPKDDINIFSWDRFESGNYVRGQYDYSILG